MTYKSYNIKTNTNLTRKQIRKLLKNLLINEMKQCDTFITDDFGNCYVIHFEKEYVVCVYVEYLVIESSKEYTERNIK